VNEIRPYHLGKNFISGSFLSLFLILVPTVCCEKHGHCPQSVGRIRSTAQICQMVGLGILACKTDSITSLLQNRPEDSPFITFVAADKSDGQMSLRVPGDGIIAAATAM